MMRIACPHCGLRSEDEFRCGGEAHIERPADPAAVDDQTWAAYLYLRENPKGTQLERWHHRYGCGQWFNLARDLVSHEVLAVYAMGEPQPNLAVEGGT
ncbi:MAG: sarcosine oxidase subunit delta [Pseudohaliea sp.]